MSRPSAPKTSRAGPRGRLRARARVGGALPPPGSSCCVASLTAPLWEPYPVDDQDPRTPWPAVGQPLARHRELGSDVLTRIAAGSWISVGPALLAVVVAFGIGIPLPWWRPSTAAGSSAGSAAFAELLLALPP